MITLMRNSNIYSVSHSPDESLGCSLKCQWDPITAQYLKAFLH